MELKLIERGDLKFTQIKVGVKEYENVCKPVGEAQRRIQIYDSSMIHNFSSYTLVCGLIVDMVPIKKNSKFIYYMFEGDLLKEQYPTVTSYERKKFSVNNLLFRAKQRDTHNWVYGYPVRGVDCCHAAWMMYIPAANPDENTHTVFIDEATLGIWTGLRDEHTKKIFHGDIGVLTVFDREGQDYQYNVEAIFDDAYGLRFDEVPSRNNGGWWSYGCNDFDLESQFEIIGNRWDNPKLLGGTKDGN